MIKKLFLMILFLFMAGATGFWLARQSQLSFERLNQEQIYQQIIAQKNLAVQKAVESGDYRCCIKPPCTMCYMEANQWNYGQAGTCACDDLIALGQDPCPECKRGLCGTAPSDTCQISEN